MEELQSYLRLIFESEPDRVIISNPAAKSEPVKKIVVEKKKERLPDCQIHGKTGVSRKCSGCGYL